MVYHPIPGHGYVATVTYVIDQSTVNEFTFGKNWTTSSYYVKYLGQVGRDRMANPPHWFKDSDIPVDNKWYAIQLPAISFGDRPSAPLTSFKAPSTNYVDIWSWQDNITKIIGRHNLKTGFYGEWTEKEQHGGGTRNYMGNYTFYSGSDRNYTWQFGNTGSGLANALLGNFYSYQEGQKIRGDFWFHNVEVYVQDNWVWSARFNSALKLTIPLTTPTLPTSAAVQVIIRPERIPICYSAISIQIRTTNGLFNFRCALSTSASNP
jgi:hypothetical protein